LSEGLQRAVRDYRTAADAAQVLGEIQKAEAANQESTAVMSRWQQAQNDILAMLAVHRRPSINVTPELQAALAAAPKDRPAVIRGARGLTALAPVFLNAGFKRVLLTDPAPTALIAAELAAQPGSRDAVELLQEDELYVDPQTPLVIQEMAARIRKTPDL